MYHAKQFSDAVKFPAMPASFSVFYLVGGSSNFVCKSMNVRFATRQEAENEVAAIKKMGYNHAMTVKNGHVIGGYCSFSDFDTPELALKYYQSL